MVHVAEESPNLLNLGIRWGCMYIIIFTAVRWKSIGGDVSVVYNV